MPIKLISGLPGAGKSLRAVQAIRKAALQRPVYVFGLDGLQAFGGWEPLADPNDWQSLPDGSLVVVDEAQKIWPSSRGADPIPPVRALSEHRHRGFDFLLITQHPTMLHSYVRKLVGEHEHLLRQFGTQSAKLYRWSEVQEDPASTTARQVATFELWPYPQDCFPLYQSATLHTVKRKIPLRLLALVVVVPVVAVLGWFAMSTARGMGNQLEEPAPAAVAVGGAAATPTAKGEGPPALDFTPRVAAQPWTAPAFDGLKPEPPPRIMCMSTKTTCRCVTHQGTPWRVPGDQCRTLARWGQYDPFLAVEKEGPRSYQPAAPPVNNDRAQPVVGIDTPPTSVGTPEQGRVW